MGEIRSLNGLWNFLIDPSDSAEWWGEYFKKQTENPRFAFISGFEKLAWQSMRVPGCWNLQDRVYLLYEGLAWYVREFDLPPEWKGRHVHLRFDGVNERAKVWLNDELLGSHEGAWTPFEFEITRLVKEKGNYLAVKADNRRLPDSPAPAAPYANFGGMHRGVSIYTTGAARLAWVAVQPRLEEDYGKALLSIQTEIAVSGSGSHRVRAEVTILDPDGEAVAEAVREAQVDGGGLAADRFEVTVSDPLLWGPGHPHLYSICVHVTVDGRSSDELSKRFGIREVAVRAGRITLNGEPVFLKGAGRHDEYPGLGRTLDDEIWRKDFDIVRGMNGNAVRLVHYPHDEREIEMADELGLLLWEEIPVIFFADFKNPAVTANACRQLEELIRRDINHPSVILWGVANEVQSDTAEVAECIKTEIELARRLDPTRLVSFASWPLDLEKNTPLALVDVIAINRYRGWYDPDIPALTPELRAYRTRYPDKAIIVSEFGAGGIRGFRAASGERWSEEFQASVIRENIEYMLKSDVLSGVFIWCLADHGGLMPNNIYERGFNNKGLVDSGRIPKQAYWVVKELFDRIDPQGQLSNAGEHARNSGVTADG